MSKLLPLLLFLGFDQGVPFYSARPGVTRAMLADAGASFTGEHALATCQVRNHCRVKADGGMWPRYANWSNDGLYFTGLGRPAVGVRFPGCGPTGSCLDDGGWGSCFEVVGDGCNFDQSDAGCGDASVCNDDGGQPVPKVATSRCVCRATAGGLCRYANPDGGTALNVPLGRVWPRPVAGAGCVAVETCVSIFGEESPLPAECL